MSARRRSARGSNRKKLPAGHNEDELEPTEIQAFDDAVEEGEQDQDDVYDEDEDVDEDDDVEDEDDDDDEDEDEDDDDGEDDDDDDDDDDDADSFEDQGSASDDDGQSADDSDGSEDETLQFERAPREPSGWNKAREEMLDRMRRDGSLAAAQHMDVADLSSDDDEANRNTVGNVPLRWYEDYKHIGYGLDGKRIARSSRGDGLERALANEDDPNFSRTVYDAYNDREIVLSDRDLLLIERMLDHKHVHPEHDDMPDYVDFYTSKKEIHPLSNDPEPKRRFVPSKWERMKVMKIVRGIHEGRIKLHQKPKKPKKHYELWNDTDQPRDDRKGPMHVPAPKMQPPGHAESYNPPEEYLMTPEEIKKWNDMDPDERPQNFIPKKHRSMREVGVYQNGIQERFERCLDLYLCPRVMKRRLNIDPESLVPKLPKPRELRPFPTTLCTTFDGHTGRVVALATSPTGQFMASGSDDSTVRLWEVETGRCVRQWTLEAPVVALQWNPNPDFGVLAVAAGRACILIVTGTGSRDELQTTNELFAQAEEECVIIAPSKLATEHDDAADDAEDEDEESDGEAEEGTEVRGRDRAKMKWKVVKYVGSVAHGVRLRLECKWEVKQVSWHSKGDYVATVAPAGLAAGVQIHQVSRARTQMPFRKNKGQVQTVAFHVSKPILFVATQRHVRVYNLVSQSMVKKLQSGAKWISDVALHPSGDHIVTTSYDCRVSWFDLDLSSSPFRTLRYHSQAVRKAAFHPHFPLLASASDDGTVHIFHARVFSDLMKNPLIVPLKILRGHEVSGGMGVMSIVFHPTQPWIFSGGADGTIRLFSNIP